MIQQINIQTEQVQNTEELHDFYTASYTKNGLQIRFDKDKFLYRLQELGLYRYTIDDNTSEIVRIFDNKIRLAPREIIIDMFEDYILKLPTLKKTYYKKVEGEEPNQVEISITTSTIRNKFLDNMQNLFSPDMLSRLRPNSSIDIMEDDIDNKYIFFNNTAICVTKNGVQKIPYSSLTQRIWDSSIIDIDYTYDSVKGDFEVFIEHICADDNSRKKSLMSLIGYLMHNNYESSEKAIMFTDVNFEDAGNAAGGTGKGLIGKALAKVLNRKKTDCRYISIPGKGFEFKDTRYSRGDISTQLIHLEDIDKNFKFECLYNDISDGALFRKLHHDPVIHMCKFMLSVNHTINFRGSSDKRRLIIFELHNYYSEKFTPEDEFGKRFFESKWTDEDWNRFYTFMICCSEIYMKYGIIEPETVNYENRLIQEQIPEDFVFFFESKIRDSVAHQTKLKINKKFYWDIFRGDYPDFNKYPQSAFSRWCSEYLTLKHIRSGHVRTTEMGKHVDYLVLFPDAKDTIFKYIVK
ncbi:MAG: hypothetical protein NC038_07760 [Paludibacter sp.]|nr:hypothetical protein [Prevotella sp.]MCM1443638.1 hypothetical protein [Muribaculum sp.]MCM1482513.1 hypothetical protein [Paludibacter sp.]MCM1576889.1 hypothetical protein [Bacteroides sp.]